MRFLLVAADKSKQLTVDVPKEIVAHTKVSEKLVESKKSKSRKAKKRSVANSNISKKKTKTHPKRRQLARPIAK